MGKARTKVGMKKASRAKGRRVAKDLSPTAVKGGAIKGGLKEPGKLEYPN